MSESKVFRVFISERFAFHVDIEAVTAAKAVAAVRKRLDDYNRQIVPIEDQGAHTGYQV
jgi:hypothetical protein